MGNVKSGKTGKFTAGFVVALMIFSAVFTDAYNIKSAYAATASVQTCASGPCASSGTILTGLTNYVAAIGVAAGSIIGYLSTDITTYYFNAYNPLQLTIRNTYAKGISQESLGLWKWIGIDFTKFASQISVLEVQRKVLLGLAKSAAVMQNTMGKMQDEKLEVQRRSRASDSIKQVATLMGGVKRAQMIQYGFNIANTVSTLVRTSGSKSEDSEEADHSGGGVKDQGRRWRKYVENYCRKDDNNGNSGCTEDRPNSGEDIDVAYTIFGKETIDVTDAHTLDAVNELIINISEPFMKRLIPQANIAKSQTGQEAVLENEKYKARRQVVYDAVNHIVGRRVPGSLTGSSIMELRSKAGIDVAMNIGSNPSYNEVMHVLVNERYRTGSYAVGQIDDPENGQRERVVQNALYLMQLNDLTEVIDRQAMILAARLSEEIRNKTVQSSSLTSAIKAN